MSIKKDSSNNILILTKTNMFRFDLIQGLLDNDNFKIRLLVDDQEKANNTYFSTREKFESIKSFEFEKSISHQEYIKRKELVLHNLDSYQKYFEKKRGYYPNKIVIFLDDFIKVKERSSSENFLLSIKSSELTGSDQLNFSIIEKFNYIIFSDLKYFKSLKLSRDDKNDKDIKFYPQLFYLLKVLKLNDVDKILFADSLKYKNTFEGLLIRSILSTYGIKYNFFDFAYFVNDKNYRFFFALKFLVFKNKKYVHTKFTLKQIYEKLINDYAINLEILKDADKKACIEKEMSLSRLKVSEEIEEEFCLDKDKIGENNNFISAFVKTFQINRKDNFQKNLNSDTIYNNSITRIFSNFVLNKLSAIENPSIDNIIKFIIPYILVKNINFNNKLEKNQITNNYDISNNSSKFSKVLDILEKYQTKIPTGKDDEIQSISFSQYLRFKHGVFKSNVFDAYNLFCKHFSFINPFLTKKSLTEYPFERNIIITDKKEFMNKHARYLLYVGISLNILYRIKK